MSNLIIQNEMDSTLDLSSINDVNGNPVSLWPRGDERASREITEATSLRDDVQRVVKARWARLVPVVAAYDEASRASTREILEDGFEGLKRGMDPALEHFNDSQQAAEEPAAAAADFATATAETAANESPSQASAGLDQVADKMPEAALTVAQDNKAPEPRDSRKGRRG